MTVDDPSKFTERFSINSPRLNNWDYSTPGIYFITICTVHHNKFFGKIINGQMELSDKGIITKQELLKTFKIRNSLKLHEYIIMPNHIHVLMEIEKQNYNQLTGCRDVLQNVSTINNNVSAKQQYFSLISPHSNSISNAIKEFKSSVTRRINPKTTFFAWQPRFYDEIIKDKNRFFAIKQYIKNNPKNWEKDEYNS
jgi:putative transposase